MPTPVILKRRFAFALAASLGCAPGSAPAQDADTPVTHDAYRAAGVLQNTKGQMQCNVSVVGSHFILTAAHCPNTQDDAYSVVTASRKLATALSTGAKNSITLTQETIQQMEAGSMPAYRQDEKFLHTATDKALRLTNGDLSKDVTPLPLAPADTLPWRPTEYPDFSYVRVKQLAFWPQDAQGNSARFKVTNCHLLRLHTMKEAFATTCPAIPGVSGSALVVDNPDGSASIAAIMTSYQDTSLSKSAFVKAFAQIANRTRIQLAAGTGSLAEMCKSIEQCALTYDARGHFTLNYRP